MDSWMFSGVGLLTRPEIASRSFNELAITHTLVGKLSLLLRTQRCTVEGGAETSMMVLLCVIYLRN
jgi:hypothetical protein